jgi:hypothetical protein
MDFVEDGQIEFAQWEICSFESMRYFSESIGSSFYYVPRHSNVSCATSFSYHFLTASNSSVHFYPYPTLLKSIAADVPRLLLSFYS